jgi:hypothetical protein
MVFRINKTRDYSVMSNYHLRDKNLSLKAKGMLSLMLSLPENWDYSVRGLEKICIESKNAINRILNELERNKYLVRKRVYFNGKISQWEYNIYETNLYPQNEDIQNEDIQNQDIENGDINKIKNNKILNNKILKNIYIKPTLEEVQEYCKERKNNVDPRKFYDYYEVNDWIDNKGNKVKNWKQKLITWEKHNTEDNSKTPDWFNEDIKEVHDIKKEEELKDLLKEFKDEINN